VRENTSYAYSYYTTYMSLTLIHILHLQEEVVQDKLACGGVDEEEWLGLLLSSS
jgi:hypothetical protein